MAWGISGGGSGLWVPGGPVVELELKLHVGEGEGLRLAVSASPADEGVREGDNTRGILGLLLQLFEVGDGDGGLGGGGVTGRAAVGEDEVRALIGVRVRVVGSLESTMLSLEFGSAAVEHSQNVRLGSGGKHSEHLLQRVDLLLVGDGVGQVPLDTVASVVDEDQGLISVGLSLEKFALKIAEELLEVIIPRVGNIFNVELTRAELLDSLTEVYGVLVALLNILETFVSRDLPAVGVV